MKRLLPHLWSVLALLLVSPGVWAQPCTTDSGGNFVDPAGQPCNNAVTTAVPFLRITPNARSAGMGDAGIALSPDPNAMHFNASSLAFAEEKLGISATYTPWLRSLGLSDVYLAYLSAFYRFDDQQALGFDLRFFSLGSIQFTDENGEILIDGRPNEFSLSLAYARKLSENFSAALSGRFIYSNLAAGQEVPGTGEILEPGIAGAADITMTYNTPIKLKKMDSELTVGLALTNIGSKITYTRSTVRDFLPANFGLGVAYTLEFDDYNSLTFTTDINKLMAPTPCINESQVPGEDTCDEDNNGIADYREQSSISGILNSWADAPGGFSEELREFYFAFGAEYWYNDLFAVRAGYFLEHALKGNRKYFTLGLGLKYNIVGIDISYLIPSTNQRNPLDNTLRFSLMFLFDDLGDNN